MPANIHILSSDVADKIAAGEVIQRPASAVKELLENSIDAGAKEITVAVRDAGSSLIQVVDDGEGIPADQILVAFQRHATSKISAARDLERITTLGFRGEALASIASVSQVEIRSRTEGEDVASQVRIDGGVSRERTAAAAPRGTSIAVRNLFYNTPARRNFLKSRTTELRNITDVVTRTAIAYPEIGFKYVSDDETLIDVRAAEPAQRMRDLFGKKQADFFVPVQEETEYLSIAGFLGKPAFLRKSRSDQYFFLNRRYIQSRALGHAVFQAYEHLLEKGAFPFFALNLTIDPSRVDVNVHPSKLEVKFENESDVYRFVLSVVRRTLAAHDLAPPLGSKFPAGESPDFRSPSPPGQSSGTSLAAEWKLLRGGRFPESPTAPTIGSPAPLASAGAETGEGLAVGRPPAPGREGGGLRVVQHQAAPDVLGSEPRAIWQVHNKYILSQVKTGVMIVDQHVAHERILYERALSGFDQNLPSSQQLLFPQTIELSAADYGTVKELLPDLERLGFSLKPFGKNTVVVEGIPADVRIGNEGRILQDVLEEFKANELGGTPDVRDNLAKSYACKAAIKAGDRLNTAEMVSLIDQLFATSMPYVCPHGRPVIVKLTIDELDRRFGRT